MQVVWVYSAVVQVAGIYVATLSIILKDASSERQNICR